MDSKILDLESVIKAQKEQLSRYEKRLKDVVTAYKGLLKEKEALESSLTAITSQQSYDSTNIPTISTLSSSRIIEDISETGHIVNEVQNLSSNNAEIEKKSHLQTQLLTLMNSIATLSAEKSRMESSFQADKKQLISKLARKDQIIDELQSKIKEVETNTKTSVEEMKSKWLNERQEREKETNNQMLMIRELQKLYADEHHLKENIEMQLNNFKIQFANNETENSRLYDLQTKLQDAQVQLKELQMTIPNKNTSDSNEKSDKASALLSQLQQEMRQLKEQHAIAIKNEQRRVQMTEEESRRQIALHEERVAKLEARLAELSQTVGTYDRLRQEDQQAIQDLKKELHNLDYSTRIKDITPRIENESSIQDFHKSNNYLRKISTTNIEDPEIVASIIDEIIRLKKSLLSTNVLTSHAIDLSKIFAINTDHTQCESELNSLTQQLEQSQLEIHQLIEDSKQQKQHISTLQEKVQVLNRNIDDQELELKQHAEELRLAVAAEKSKWKKRLHELENEYHCRHSDLEQQLQKQRQRSLQLLEEKEHEIKALQTSYEIFHGYTNIEGNFQTQHNANFYYENGSFDDSRLNNNAISFDTDITDELCHQTNGENLSSSQQRKCLIKIKKSIGDSCHMLHYANELARKDLEIAHLRKTKYSAEQLMRTVLHEKVTVQQELNTQISDLEEKVDRLERCQTREGANLEYLKNVIISYIISKDSDDRKHMMNAISAVLQFTPNEMQTINQALH